MANILYLEKIADGDRDAFADKIQSVANDLGVLPSDLTIVMNSESGMDPQAINPDGGATGLIQFMPASAAGLGTSTGDLYNMSASEQLDYVHDYFLPYKGQLKNAYGVYLATFFPAAIGKPNSWVLEANGLSRSIIARSNPAIDLNKDNQITVGEFKKWFQERTGIQMWKYHLNPFNAINVMWHNRTLSGKFAVGGATGLIVIVGSLYLLLSNKKTK